MSWDLGTSVDFESAEKLLSQTSFYWLFGKTQVISIRQESHSASFPSKKAIKSDPSCQRPMKFLEIGQRGTTSWHKK